MQIRDAIYLDVNAGALLHPEVIKALSSQDLILGGNPSSIHAHGRKAKNLISDARSKIASSLGLHSREATRSILFTSSGSEANQLVIKSTFIPLVREKKKIHWITTPVEHSCNLKMVEWVKGFGGEVSFLPVDSQGRANISALASLVRPETALVSLIWVNNETGVINDIESFARECARLKIPLHLDGAQAWGKLPVELEKLAELGVSYAAFAAHKIGGLSGNGVLWAKEIKNVFVTPGTENTIGISIMGVAAAQIDLSRQPELAGLRDRLQSLITSKISGVIVNGGDAPRVAGTLSLSFDGISKQGLVQSLDLEGFSVSSGSACASGNPEPSHVLRAMGRTFEQASAAARISFGPEMPWSDLERFALALEKTVTRMRNAK
jgi:cysteine desulfurase